MIVRGDRAVKNIWAFVELSKEKINRSSEEALSEAIIFSRQVKGISTALILGSAVSERLLAEIETYGPDRVMIIEHDILSSSTSGYVHCIEYLVSRNKPNMLFFGSTPLSREVAPRLSARLRCGLVTEATYLHNSGDKLLVTRHAYRPHASMIVSFQDKDLQMIMLAPKVMDVNKMGPCSPFLLEKVGAPLNMPQDRVRIEEVIFELPSQVDLTDADVIVAGGRGMQDKNQFRLLDDLAQVLEGKVAGTRMAMDLKWCSRDSMVGITGTIVSPDLYIACGISGAIQHVMGMRSSRNIIAINIDPNAPIFRIASLGIIGDIAEVLPVITKSFKQIKTHNTTEAPLERGKS